MPVGGYDPEDLDETLAEVATEADLQDLLTEEERAQYESGDAGLFDLLSGADIERLLARHEDVDPSDVDPTTDNE